MDGEWAGKSWEGREGLKGREGLESRGLLSWGLLAISKDQLSKAWGSNGVFPGGPGTGASRFCLEIARIWCLSSVISALGTRLALRARLCPCLAGSPDK